MVTICPSLSLTYVEYVRDMCCITALEQRGQYIVPEDLICRVAERVAVGDLAPVALADQVVSWARRPADLHKLIATAFAQLNQMRDVELLPRQAGKVQILAAS